MEEQQHDEKNEKMSMELLMKNNMGIDNFQTVIYIAGGVISGILGLTGLSGLALYLAVTVVTSLALVVKMKLQIAKFTDASLLGLATKGLMNYALSFVLFWTLSYALVHIY
jgi:ER membrane protein complex subunit 6